MLIGSRLDDRVRFSREIRLFFLIGHNSFRAYPPLLQFIMWRLRRVKPAVMGACTLSCINCLGYSVESHVRCFILPYQLPVLPFTSTDT